MNEITSQSSASWPII
uniref:Uncharacterized protein n=1 Tax=Rhizophora mucronata TaxID=61149 RepID=A0A2P2PEE2_RHIMU